METKETQRMMQEILERMVTEENAGFPNGNLWNELDDQFYYLANFGQPNSPEKIFDENGVQSGYRLNDGTEVYFEGMTFENSY